MNERKGRAECGTHTELAKTSGVRITRCACGTVHLHVARSGVTLQLSDESLSHLAAATAEAMGELERFASPTNASPNTCVN